MPITPLPAYQSGGWYPWATALDGVVRGIGITNGLSPDLTRWRRAIARVLSGTADAKLLILGDSGPAGVGAVDGSQGSGQTFGLQLAARMNGLVPAAQGYAIPESNVNGAVDYRYTKGTNWQTQPYGIWGSCYQPSSSSNGGLTFQDPNVLADRFDVYYLTNGGGVATITATATGGSAVNGTDTGGQGFARITVSAGSAAKTNSVSIATSGGFVAGIEPWLSTQKRIRVGNVSNSGVTSAQFDRGSPWGFQTSNFMSLYKPDLVLISVGSNDGAAGTAAATVVANIQSVYNAIIAADCDAIVMTPWTVSPSGTSGMITNNPVYAAALRATNMVVMDTYSRQVAQTLVDRSMMYDGNHRNPLGQGDMAQGIAHALMSV